MPVMQSVNSTSPPKDFVLTTETSSLIRGIILSRGRDGCTLDQIKEDYFEHVGVKFHHTLGDNELRKIISSIEYIRSREKSTPKGKQIFYFSEHPQQEHLVKMIRNQRSNGKSSPPKCNRQFSNSSRRGKGFYNNNKKSRGNSTAGSHNSSMHSEYGTLTHSQDALNESSNINDTTFVAESIIPLFHGCPLIGDDFFYTLATIDLGFPKVSYDSSNGSTCMNGLTIRMAVSKLDHIETGSIIIVNLGSNDILNDRPLVSMMEDMVGFLSTCNKKQIIPILTTLAPLPTYHLGNRRDTLTNFNRFIKVNPFNYPVIDLHPSFVFFGKIELHAFQPEPRHAVGYKKKIMMWNKVGRKRVLQKLSDHMGTAIVDIYTYYSVYNIQVLKWHCGKLNESLDQTLTKVEN